MYAFFFFLDFGRTVHQEEFSAYLIFENDYTKLVFYNSIHKNANSDFCFTHQHIFCVQTYSIET